MTFRLRFLRLPARFSRGWLVLVALAGASTAPGQDAIMGVPSAPLTTVNEREAAAAAGPSFYSPYSNSPDTPFQAGPVVFHPSLLYRYLNAEGLPVGARRVASEIRTWAPDFRFDLGKHWYLDYAPTWTDYTARAFNDTVDQFAAVGGNIVTENWLFSLKKTIALASPTLVETARQTKERTELASLGAARSFGSKMSLELGGSLNEHYGDTFPDTNEWATQNWLTFHLTPTLDVGLGLGAGYVEIDHGPDTTYQRYLGRFNWTITDKLSFSIDGGVDDRQSQSAISKPMHNPLLDASLTYRPFATTRLGVTASQTVSSALYQYGQVSTNSTLGVSFEQRLLEHFYFSMDLNHSETAYHSSSGYVLPPLPEAPPDDSEADPVPPSPGIPILISLPGRKDSVDFFNARFTFQFLKRLSFAATYQQSRNNSNQAGFSFDSKQYGIELTCRY